MTIGPVAIGTIFSLTLAACSAGTGTDGDTDALSDQPVNGTACSPPPTYMENVAACTAAATDYQPRNNGSLNDSWAACISDDNTYHQIALSISSIARVEAYEKIGEKLWSPGATPSHRDFIDMRVLFEEDQGLGSRVARRYDTHYTAPATGRCDEAGVAAAAPDYCVGPATLQPLIVAAFADGSLGQNRIVNAARIEAAVQWFLYVSSIKEATTCNVTPKDCDSCWGYYDGGTPRGTPIGLAADIDALAPETHDRAYDGVLAVRCWKNLDNQTGTSIDLTLRDQAITQLDTALLRGMALLIRQRFAEIPCATGDYRDAALEALRVLVPLFDHATRERDAVTASLLAAEVQKDAAQIDVAGILTALDTVYNCP